MLSLRLVRGAENADGVRLVVHVPPDQARFVIGRDPTCDWPIPDRQLALSARHCEIVRVEGKQVLRDTSTNGTFVNDARERLPADHVLRHGDRLRLGNYAIEVAVVPDSAAVAAVAAPAAASPPAPRRGGDPAAMVGADWERVAVRVGSAAPDVKTGLTRISKPPPKEVMQELLAAAPRAEVAEAAGAAESPAPREVAHRAPPGSTDVLARLAGALNVPIEALGTTDPALAAHRVATLLRVAVWALHRQLGEQAQQLNAMGSRAPLTLSSTEAAPLRMAPGRDAAVAALLAAGPGADAMLLMAIKDLGQHAHRLLGAFGAATQRLGDQLAPAALERSAGDGADPARLWRIYSSLWTALGIGVGKSWTDGYAEAATAYLAAAYDDPQWAEKAPAERAPR
jgi:type VI secretion system protein ImpI